MENNILDTIAIVQQTCNAVNQSLTNRSVLDTIYKIAMICIAFFNIFFAIYIFNFKNRKDDYANERNRKIGLLKSLVLDHNMKYLYDFFENIDKEVQALKLLNININEKRNTNDNLINLGIILRQNFIDTLIAIDKGLYTDIILTTDNLLDTLTENIFDEGINLSHLPMFEQKITKLITENKTSIIKTLFSYKGD